MSHLTKKKKIEKEKNNRSRGFNGFDTGTKDMGFGSNQERKVKIKTDNEKSANKELSNLIK